MKKIICLYGRPASGKTTQAKRLIAEFDYSYFGMGERLRSETDSGSDLGRKIQSYVDRGTLIPDDYMIKIIEDVGRKMEKNILIFDGFPRMISQARMLEKIIQKSDLEMEAFVYLKVSTDEARRRIKSRSETSQRKDDQNIEAVQNRLDVFERESLPLLDYYRQLGKLIEIEGEMNINEVYTDLKRKLGK